jgi:hypothetical protein
VITTFGRDFAATNTETTRAGKPGIGRQSQAWVRTTDGWRIAAAHDWGRLVPRGLQIVTHALRAKARAVEAVPVAHGQGSDVTLLPVSSATPHAQRRS